ncbi:hypothetical protein GCM10007086_41760 [Photobacterium aphoticum]|nr:hypothetical protein GCM10007086_41760 [Photobacterium aphoticum]
MRVPWDCPPVFIDASILSATDIKNLPFHDIMSILSLSLNAYLPLVAIHADIEIVITPLITK